MERGDFYEDDEPVRDVVQAFESGVPFVTGRNPATGVAHGWFCRHVSFTSSHVLGMPTAWCGCAMTPLHAVA